jgi:hypothetical protein
MEILSFRQQNLLVEKTQYSETLCVQLNSATFVTTDKTCNILAPSNQQ